MTSIEDFIQAARRHGEDSDPDHEVGDLQDGLRAAWNLMTAQQRAALMASDAVLNMAEVA